MAKIPNVTPNPKQAAIMALVAAFFGVSVLYYPPLKPVCEALNFCTPDVVAEPSVSGTTVL